MIDNCLPEVYRADEVDFVKLFRNFWQHKWTLLLTTCFGLVLGGGYVLFARPLYEVKVVISPPMQSDITPFNSLGLFLFDVNTIYQIFTDQLLSEVNRKHFFESVAFPKNAQNYNQFSSHMFIIPNKEKFFLKVRDRDPLQAAKWAKTYIAQMNDASMHQVKQIIKREKELQLIHLENEIQSLKKIAKKKRYDRLAVLNEAIVIAKAVGLEKQSSSLSTTKAIIDVSALREPGELYLRGVQSLRAEMGNLSQRVDDAPFVPQLRELEEKYELLKRSDIILKNGITFRLDEAVIPETPLPPGKILVLLIATILGLMFGLILIFFRNILRTH